MSKKFIDLANLKSNLENFLSEIISPTFATKEGVSKQLGNHTVKSDVPENAVFTDTKDWESITGKPDSFPPSSHGHTISEITGLQDTLDGKASASHTHTKSQITDFPTSMPANGGNADTVNSHTVKSDVPKNAVFTDTVYDDTEVQNKLNKVATYENYWNGTRKWIKLFTLSPAATNIGDSMKFIISSRNHYEEVSISVITNDASQAGMRIIDFTTNLKEGTSLIVAYHNKVENLIDVFYASEEIWDTSNFNIVHHITSDRIVCTVHNTDSTIPEETENYVKHLPTSKFVELDKRISNNGYGEVAGGKNLLNPKEFLKWVNQYTIGSYSNDGITISPVNAYLYNNFFKFSDVDIDVTLSIKSLTFEDGSNPRVCLVNSSGTIIGTVTTDTPSISGLACGIKIDFTTLPTSITIKELMIEEGSIATEYEPYFPSNKMLAEEKADKKETTVNLLNPKLQTTTNNGITCTYNGDGTYTLNGTAVSTTYFRIKGITALAQRTTNKTYKLVGCPTGGINKYDLRYEINGSTANGGGKDFGDGVIIKNDKINSTDITSAEIIIAVMKDIIVNNLVFKPMLTTNLNATYDDFVPYTGDSGSLNGDVAQINESLGNYALKSLYGDTTINVGRLAGSAIGNHSTAEGDNTIASGYSSHAEGDNTTASGNDSHAEGYYTKATNYASHASGKYNTAMTTGGASDNTTGTAFVIGNGTSNSALSNAFSVQYDGTVKAKSTITASTTADYAEFFEWLDKNPNEEDRVGHFVTLDGDKIKIATAADDYILGIVSGEPFVLGNGDCDTWNGMYLHDEFRRTMYEPAPKMIEILDNEGNPTGDYEEVEGEYEGTRPILNPDYDPTQEYISRFDRVEWSPIGMLGVLAVLHDGTAEVNGYVTVNNEGIATKCTRDTRNSYRVIKKVSDKVVEVIFR